VTSACLWSDYDGTPKSRPLSWLLCFSFYPTWLLLGLGQVSILNLVALAGFLHFVLRGADFRAGLMASFIAVKPHVLIVYALAVFVWIVLGRRWRLMLGGVCGLVLLSLPMLATNPGVFAQFVSALASRGPTYYFSPTPGSLLRLFFGGTFWPTLLPVAAGVLWLAVRMARRWRSWDWRAELPALTFASFFAAPYAGVYDLVILLVPLTPAAVRACAGCVWRGVGFFGIHVAISLIALEMNLQHRAEFEYVWMAPAVLAIYVGFMVSESRAT
jgi:hypothetical protein